MQGAEPGLEDRGLVGGSLRQRLRLLLLLEATEVVLVDKEDVAHTSSSFIQMSLLLCPFVSQVCATPLDSIPK